jgi:hypothetical protein
VENIRWSMLQNLNTSFAGFARKARERLDETVAATQGAMQAAHTRRKAQNGSIDAEANRLEDRMAALEAVKSQLIILQSADPPADAPPSPESRTSITGT